MTWTSRPTRALAARPDLEQIKRQAKELLAAFIAGDHAAVEEVKAHERHADPETFALHDAQRVLARSYGFASWARLKAHVDGFTVRALIDAVRAGDEARVRDMLRVRPELVHMDVGEHDEHRALHHAVLTRSPSMVRLLMRRGADARQGIYPHRDATCALVIAMDRGYDEIVGIILEEETRRSVSRDAGTAPPLVVEAGPLTAAVTQNRADLLAALLARGIDPDERTRIESVEDVVYTAGAPLRHCAETGKLDMARMLLEYGANPNAQVYASGSAMHVAYMARDVAMIALLERHGGVVDAITVGTLGDTPRARQMLADEAAGRLRPGAVAGMLGGTAVAEDLLWSAAGAGAVDIVRMALEHIDWPRDDHRWYTVLREPLYLGMDPSPVRREAALMCFRLVLDRADLHVHGNREHGWVGGRTLLHDLASSRHRMRPEDAVAFATILLDAGARLDVRDELLQSTPLGWACRWGRLELVELYLARGADPAEPEAEPWARPCEWARKYRNDRVLRALDAM